MKTLESFFLLFLIPKSVWLAFRIDVNQHRIECVLDESELKQSFSDARSGNFSNLLLYEQSEWLFLTGDDFVFRLDSRNINDSTSARERRTPITNKAAANEQQRNPNSIRLLIHRKSHSDLIVCGTNAGKSHIYDLKEADLSFQVEYNGRYLCPSSDVHPNLGVITRALGAKLMFSALWIDDDTKYGLFRKDVEYNGHFLRTLDSKKWLWEPRFVSLIDFEQFVFCFFTELDSDGSIRVARIARVCKNDQGISFEDKSKHLKS